LYEMCRRQLSSGMFDCARDKQEMCKNKKAAEYLKNPATREESR